MAQASKRLIDQAKSVQVKAAVEESEKVQLLMRENARLRKRSAVRGALTELIVETVHSAIDNLPSAVTPKRPRIGRRKQDELVPVAHLSDTQIGKVTSTYDSEIAAQRIAEFGERVCRIAEAQRAHAKIRKIHLYLGGDMVEGETIFPGQAHSIDSAVIDQAVGDTPLAITRLVMMFLEVFPEVHIESVAGNHGRSAPRNSGANPKSNWDTVAYETARLMLLGSDAAPNLAMRKRVTFNVADTFYAVDDVLGHRNLIVHGHQIRGGFAGFPFYGVGKKMGGWIDSVPSDWQNLYFGHFHTYASGVLNLRRWHCNGTTESDNEYAREELAACGVPVQRLQFFDREHGIVSDHPVYLTHGLN